MMENLPEDLQIVLVETLCIVSVVSVKIFAHVNKFYYRLSRECALKYHIDKPLKCEQIAIEGSLGVLIWAKFYTCEWTCLEVCLTAAKYGHLHILEWMRWNDCYYDNWEISVCATKNNHIHILQWIHANNLSMSKYLCSYAAKHGYLDVLKWAQSINYVDSDIYGVYQSAVDNGHLEIVKWLKLNGYLWCMLVEMIAKSKWPEIVW